MNAGETHSAQVLIDQESAVCAVAHPNIALVKYWGKRESALNLPAVSSLSITLDTLATTTHLQLGSSADADALTLNGQNASEKQQQKLTVLCDLFRDLSGSTASVHVASTNNFPTAAGLASSASGYAALVKALDCAFNTELGASELSVYARQGSGSAARSLFGGFAHMHKGVEKDGTDSRAEALLPPGAWPLEVVVAITSEQAKDVSSTVGMESTRTTSPFYAAWTDSQEDDIERARRAVAARDFAALADVSEYSCLKMHGLMLSAQPGLLYWNAATLSCIHAVRALRADGCEVFFTIDAGPQLKAVCAPGHSAQVATVLENVPGVSRVLRTGLGTGAHIVEPGAGTL